VFDDEVGHGASGDFAVEGDVFQFSFLVFFEIYLDDFGFEFFEVYWFGVFI